MQIRVFSTLALSVPFRHAPCRATIEPGSNVMLVGGGSVLLLAARLAALRGFKTTCAVSPADIEIGKSVCYDSAHPEGSLPLSFLPLSGEESDSDEFSRSLNKAAGLILAVDADWTLTEKQLDVCWPIGDKLQHACLMSRHLNGEGMGFFADAAKASANREVWAAGKKSVDNYQTGEAAFTAKAEESNAAWTIIRAGTLKGGASGDALNGLNGEARFLNPEPFYKLGQQDVVNWRLLYDCKALGVKLSAGDTLPGPGFTAALTSTDRVGNGDSHRGAVATALVEALLAPAASNRDFGVAAVENTAFPSVDQWSEMFAAATTVA